MPTTDTPIRYPGGKSKIYPMVHEFICANGHTGGAYAEAFCGGAGLALKLLLNGIVGSIVLNDIDPAIYSIWDAIVNHSEDLCAFVETEPLTIDAWEKHHEVWKVSQKPSLELGMSAFYLNRTNRSGILYGGPIGGKGQLGKYRLDARFNRQNLIKKIMRIADNKDAISLYNLDACDFITNILPKFENVFANFDPPYVKMGPELYTNYYCEEDHRNLAKTIGRCDFTWMVTYDDASVIDSAYQDFNRYSFEISYSAHSSKRGNEILVVSHGFDMGSIKLEQR